MIYRTEYEGAHAAEQRQRSQPLCDQPPTMVVKPSEWSTVAYFGKHAGDGMFHSSRPADRQLAYLAPMLE